MSQPSKASKTVRTGVSSFFPIPPPSYIITKRPADFTGSDSLSELGVGAPGPDQGYALLLAKTFEDRWILDKGEDVHDVIVGVAAVACKRAALLKRAPVVGDIEFASRLWGFLENAPLVPADLLDRRKLLFNGAAHDYYLQRKIVDQFSNEALIAA